MRKKYFYFSFLLFILNINLCQASTLVQIGNTSAVLSGVTEGNTSISELKQYGNFGLGTFNNIAGEMIVLDSNVYQIGENGKTILADLKWKTPYAEIIHFSPKLFDHLNTIANYRTLKKIIYVKLNNKNIPYAIYVKGQFPYLKLRSRSPRSALDTKNKIEKTYDLKQINGTLVGYWFPEYLMNLTVPGFHFHFISDDKKQSGHVLDLKIEKANFALKEINKIELQFPQTDIYQKARITAPTLSTYQKIQLYDPD